MSIEKHERLEELAEQDLKIDWEKVFKTYTSSWPEHVVDWTLIKELVEGEEVVGEGCCEHR